MTERNRLTVLLASLAGIVAVLSWAILGGGGSSSCHGGWFGYTPLSGKIPIAIGHCPADQSTCDCNAQ